jgi:branched-chain amino acid:cation transporter, LIVCS family
MKNSKIFSVGCAMFAMLFGAGNVIFPLIVGRASGNKIWFGLLGFTITAVIVPLVGLISTMLCDGSYDKFLRKLGKIPGNIIIFICMILIGPFAMSARCITISYASIHPYLPQISLLKYSIVSAVIIFLLTVRKDIVMDILGKVLGPLKLILLSSIILWGFIFRGSFIDTAITSTEGFFNGLTTGYATVDLLGTIFFSGLIYSGIKDQASFGGKVDYKKLSILGLKAGVVGALLLGLMYTGFCIVAGFNGSQLTGVADSDIFSSLAILVLGSSGGWLANITVAVSTIATAMTLNVVFAEYVRRDIFANKISYKSALIASILIMATMSNLGFSGIMKIAMPFIVAIYPAIIVLAFLNIANVLYGFSWIKTPVFMTFLFTIIFQYWQYFKPFLPINFG